MRSTRRRSMLAAMSVAALLATGCAGDEPPPENPDAVEDPDVTDTEQPGEDPPGEDDAADG